MRVCMGGWGTTARHHRKTSTRAVVRETLHREYKPAGSGASPTGSGDSWRVCWEGGREGRRKRYVSLVFPSVSQKKRTEKEHLFQVQAKNWLFAYSRKHGERQRDRLGVRVEGVRGEH